LADLFNMSILEKLMKLEKSNIYPFHMPGHKRNAITDAFPYGIDITEIHDFDDLHEAEGILKEAQEAAAAVYGAKESFYLVNGSTCGILAAISAAVPMGGTVLVARNCHKAVYHAIQLRNARAVYLMPEVDEYGIYEECVLPEQIPEADACIITSPTYEGRVSDVLTIARELHKKGIPLIVDEAHGAHFVFAESFPANAGKLGADIVINSIHKTLPAPTQTALMHIYSDRISAERVKLFLDIYETSSPSYVLMAAMEQGIEFARTANWEEYSKKLEAFYEKAKRLKHIKVLRMDDPGKIVVVGRGLAGKLREQFEIEVEMESMHYVILMTSVVDTSNGFERLIQALISLDTPENEAVTTAAEAYDSSFAGEQRLTICEALEAETEVVEITDSSGFISGSYIYLYPPGIPVLVPGEVINQEAIDYLVDCKNCGLSVKGLISNKILVVKE